MFRKSFRAAISVLALSGCASTARIAEPPNRPSVYEPSRTPFVSEADRGIQKRERDEKIRRLLREIRGESP